MKENLNLHPYLCSELVSISCDSLDGDVETVPGNLEAIGEWNALVLADVPVMHGTEVTINSKSRRLKGVVERCEYDEPLGCRIEVRLRPESRWSQRWFKPQHLFALAALSQVDVRKSA